MRRLLSRPEHETGKIARQIKSRKRPSESTDAEYALRETVDEYRAIIEYAVEGIFQTTPDGRYRTANPMLARIYGYDSPEELMSSLTDIAHQLYVDPTRRDEFKRLLEDQDAVWDFESEIHRKDGSAIWIRENARAVRDAEGRLLGFEGTVEDITERRRAEEALKRAREELEIRVQERTAELAQTNAALQAEISERKRAELELEAAHEQVVAAAAEKKRFYREVIRSVTRDKFRLVDAAELPTVGDLRMEMPLITMEDYPPARERLRIIGREAGMSQATAQDFVLAAGEAITNAIKHGVRGRCLAFSTPDSLICRVCDQGEGIRSDDLPATLFQAGFSTKVSLGMGYTLMLELVDRVWLATEPQGTIVQLEKWIHPETHPDVPICSAWDTI